MRKRRKKRTQGDKEKGRNSQQQLVIKKQLFSDFFPPAVRRGLWTSSHVNSVTFHLPLLGTLRADVSASSEHWKIINMTIMRRKGGYTMDHDYWNRHTYVMVIIKRSFPRCYSRPLMLQTNIPQQWSYVRMAW